MPSILTRLWQRCEEHPDRLLYAFLNIDGHITASYTFAQFARRTAAIAAHLHTACPLEPGARVLLAYPPGLEMVCALFACVRLGLIPVPVYPPSSHGFKAALTKMEFIARDCGARAVLTDRSFYWSMQFNRVRHQGVTAVLRRDTIARLTWVVTDDSARSRTGTFPERHSEVLFLQYTSGSTNHPKGVMVTHSNVLDNCDSVVDHLPIGVSWLPQYHDMGLLGYYIYFALKGGTTYGFSPLDFIRRPALWLETLSTVRGTATSAPNFAFEYCLRPGKVPPELRDTLDLRSLRFLMVAAEPVRAHVFQAFLRTFEPCGLAPKALFSAYGLAEHTLAVSNYGRTILTLNSAHLKRDRVVPATDGASETTSLVSCGRPLGTTQVAIVREGREVAAGRVGEIWVCGASTCAGYWGRPELSREVFEATIEGRSESWLRTGDLGFMRGGELYVCGRLKDLIIVRGLNIYPQDIELVVEEDPRIRKGCVAAFAVEEAGQERVVVVGELRDRDQEADVGALQVRLRQQLGVVTHEVVFIPARTIAKTSSGKIARHRVRQHWEEGSLEVLARVRVQDPGRFPEVDGGSVAPHGGESGEDRWVTDASAVGSLVEHYGLDRWDGRALGDVGLDSIQIAELGHDLKGWLTALGHDELTDQLDLRLLQQIAVSELVELCEQLSEAAPQAKFQFHQAFARLQVAHQEAERALMRRDARFDLELEPPPVGRLMPVATPAGSDLLLTGGTGFLGPFMLRSLLVQHPEATIHVLLRAQDPEAGRWRLRKGFEALGSLAPKPGWEARMHPICGDLARPDLGLAPEVWRSLTTRVGVQQCGNHYRSPKGVMQAKDVIVLCL
ncbi:MAG: AMP-binding protein [Myxococcota bacterium]